MTPRVFRYRFSRRILYWSVVQLLMLALITGGLYLLYEGGYLSAWFTSCIIALLALMTLSIPRKIIVDRHKISVHCLLDLTEIALSEIASVRRIDTGRMKGMIPIFGGYGFFGFYGHYLDLRTFERVKIYASEWDRFVEIVDIYDDRYYVSCSDPEALVEALEEARKDPAAEA